MVSPAAADPGLVVVVVPGGSVDVGLEGSAGTEVVLGATGPGTVVGVGDWGGGALTVVDVGATVGVGAVTVVGTAVAAGRR